MWSDLVLGASLGLAAGLAPGPLHSLVMVRALDRGFGAGARVAFAPILTDAVIILVGWQLVSRLSSTLLGALELGGGLYLLWLGWSTLSRKMSAGSTETPPGRDLLDGAVTNLLNPHPWVFWIGVGVPRLLEAWRRAPLGGVAFLFAFFAMIVGAKLALAAAVSASRRQLSPGSRRRLVRISGLALITLGGWIATSAILGS